MDGVMHASALIHLGAVFYILGFLVRDELLLRVLVMTGNVFYILYYFLFPAEPLWDAIVTSAILGAANLYVMSKILLERTTFALSDNEKNLYGHFKTLNPGQFRRILKHCEWITADTQTRVCRENQPADNLYFLYDGRAMIERGGKSFEIQDGCFLGEIAFITNGEYTANVYATKGTTYVKFSNPLLKKIMKRDRELSNAVISLFNFDLAKKLSVSTR